MTPEQFSEALKEMIREEVRIGVQEGMKAHQHQCDQEERERSLRKNFADAVNEAIGGESYAEESFC